MAPEGSVTAVRIRAFIVPKQHREIAAERKKYSQSAIWVALGSAI